MVRRLLKQGVKATREVIGFGLLLVEEACKIAEAVLEGVDRALEEKA